MELGLQVQALSVNVYSETDGEFTLRFMVNIGRSNEEDANVYIGGESVVNLKNIRDFINSMHAVLTELSHST